MLPAWLRVGLSLWRDVAVIVILAAVVLAYFWPSIARGEVAYENDTRVFYYPLFARLGEALKSGSLPLWSQRLFTGYPVFADGEGGEFYPVHLLSLLALPVQTAFQWMRPLRFFQAALFSFLFCRSIGLGRFGATVGALAFTFSGFAIAQLHHTNISTAAVWMPLELAFVELALRRSGRARYAFAVLAGVAFGLQGLILHVQVVLMSAAALGAYCAFRAWLGAIGHGDGPYLRLVTWMDSHPFWHLGRLAPLAGRLTLPFALVGIAGALGAALSAVQLLPLYELSTFSFRGNGVDYAFATQYSLPPAQLVSLLLPDFFVSNGMYWGLWSHWEVFAYAGIAPLALALLGLIVTRSRLTIFFLLLGAVALSLALGEYSPFHIHRFLVQLPGFSVLRAPGRFLFLFTFAVAMLAATGADALSRHFAARRRVAFSPTDEEASRGAAGAARGAGLSAAILVLQLLAMVAPLALVGASSLVRGRKDLAVTWLQATFMRMRGFDSRYTVEHLYQFLQASLDVLQPATLRQLALLAATVALLVLWDRLRGFGRLWQVLLVVVIGVDLVGFGQQFHPMMTYDALSAPSGVAQFFEQQPGLYRVYTEKGTRDEPNRLLEFPVLEANGYSSLEPARHQQYTAMVQYAPNRLLDLMNARYYVAHKETNTLPSFNLTSFDPRRPLLSSTGRNPAGTNSFLVDGVKADSIRVVSTLRWAVAVAQGTEVALITATDVDGKTYQFRLLAGAHTSEWAWERPDLRDKAAHGLAPVAYTWQQRDGAAPPYPAHLYYVEFPLGRQVTLKRVDVQFTHPTAQVDVYGIAAYNDETKDLEQLDVMRLAKLRKAYEDNAVVVFENQTYLPRAFLVPSAVVERPGDEILSQMAQGDWSPERFVILEDQFDASPLAPPALPGEVVPPVTFNKPLGTEISSGPGKVTIQRAEADEVRIQVQAKQNAMLLLDDLMYPGWTATVDGQPAHIYRADYLFRSVYVPAGSHLVTFSYQPRSFRLGLLVTLLATAGTVIALWWLALGHAPWSRRRAIQRRAAVQARDAASSGTEPALPGEEHAATIGLNRARPPVDDPAIPAGANAVTVSGTSKGATSHGRQESEEHRQAEQAEGSGQGRQEEITPLSQTIAEAAPRHSA